VEDLAAPDLDEARRPGRRELDRLRGAPARQSPPGARAGFSPRGGRARCRRG
jgi:hypothetical protein